MPNFFFETIQLDNQDSETTIIFKTIGDKTWSQQLVENQGLHAEYLEWVAEGNEPEVIDS